MRSADVVPAADTYVPGWHVDQGPHEVTLVPVLMMLFIRGRILPEHRNPLNRALIGLYRPVLRLVLRARLPQLTGVTDVTEHEAGTEPFFSPAKR